MDSYKVQQLEKMLAHETSKPEELVECGIYGSRPQKEEME